MMQQAPHEVPGPLEQNSGLEHGNEVGDSGYKYLTYKYQEAALAARTAINFDTASADDIKRVILEKTRQVICEGLFAVANTDSAKVAIVFAFWLTDSKIHQATRTILREKQNSVFTISRVDSDVNAKQFFARVMQRGETTHPMDLPGGPFQSKMKLLETISRIVDLIS
jgi:hypothetical protein